VTGWEPSRLTARTLLTMIRRLLASLVGTVTAAIGIAGVATVLSTSSAFACSCVAPTPTVKPAPDVVVFTGTVSGVDPARNDGSATGSSPVAHLSVENVYQGSVDTNQAVLVGGGSECGYVFTVGQRYTIITAPVAGVLAISGCGGAQQGEIDPARYGLHTGVPPPIPGRSWPWGLISAALVGAVAIIAASVVVGRSRAARR
jgi:hypothetical protein